LAVHCNNCDALLPEETALADPPEPCPECGSTARRFHVEVVEKCEAEAFLGMEGRRAGLSRRKGWFIRSFTRLAAQISRGGALAYHTRVMDRDTDRYVETVTMRETGEVVHHCDEPLSEHQGHGSARRALRPASASPTVSGAGAEPSSEPLGRRT
jgi:hypothetical protein